MSASKLEKIINELSELSVLEISDLSKQLEEKWGVSAAPMMAAGPMSTGGDSSAEKTEEKTEFDVVLKAAGSQKIQTIKLVRECKSDLSLSAAKEFVDKSESEHQVIKSGVSKADADALKAKFAEIGADVEIK